MSEELGYENGDKCNRNGCIGVIDKHTKENGCSCHINPPCSSCVDDMHFCPECDWQGIEDQKPKHTQSDSEWWAGIQKKREQADIDLRDKMKGLKPITELDYRIEGHTHASQICKGVYPDGMTMEEVRQKVNGSWGGRFEYFANNNFKFIAYTD